MKINDFFSQFLNLIYPQRCILCGKIIPYGTKICDKCSGQALSVCSNKRIYIPKWGKTIVCYAPFIYKNIIRKSIIDFKFYSKTELTDFFTEKILEQITKNQSLNFDFISCVPLSKQRLKLRGYNQSELLAKSLSKKLDIPFCECLEKIKDNIEQHRLNEKSRHKNVKNVYISKNKSKFYQKSILLVDDIITTGATLTECSSVLFGDNVKQVTCAAIAQVMP